MKFPLDHGLMLLVMLTGLAILPAAARDDFKEDTFATAAGELRITFIGHGSLMLTLGETVIHVDPWTKLADYSKLPDADILLLTHHHLDHLDTAAVEEVQTDETDLVLTRRGADAIGRGTVMKNGDSLTLRGIEIAAVPAYNIVNKRDTGEPFHPRGEGNGYVLKLGGKKIYIAGDTENTPEMKALEGIDIAFLPMNLPYTMTPEMVADAAVAFRPAILYPYHYGDTDVARLQILLKDDPEIEVRIRDMK